MRNSRIKEIENQLESLRNQFTTLDLEVQEIAAAQQAHQLQSVRAEIVTSRATLQEYKIGDLIIIINTYILIVKATEKVQQGLCILWNPN